MEVNDIKIVLELAKVELHDRRIFVSPEDYEATAKSIEAVETWLREVGALPPR